jgi:hypothetical protein
MTQTSERAPSEPGALGNVSVLSGNDTQITSPNPVAAQGQSGFTSISDQRNSRAVRDARLVLIREAIFENLRGVRLFVETAQLLIEARDDTGMAHAVRMGAHHYRAAIQLVKDISAVTAEGIQ